MTDDGLFDKAQVAKYMHLPYAFTCDLVGELSKREGVQSVTVASGDRFEFHGPGKVMFVKDGCDMCQRGA